MDGLRTEAAKDEGKLKRILHILDYVTCPNEGYWLASRPMVVGGCSLEETSAGIIQNRDAVSSDPDRNMLWNWSAGIASDLDHMLWGILEWYMSPPTTPEEARQTFEARNSIIENHLAAEDYQYLVKGDPSTVADLQKFVDMNEYAFVTGQKSLDDWDEYVNEYLTRIGGNKLIDDYTQQLRTQGYLK